MGTCFATGEAAGLAAGLAAALKVFHGDCDAAAVLAARERVMQFRPIENLPHTPSGKIKR